MKLTWSETNMYSILEEMKSAEQGIIEEKSNKCWIQNDERRSKIGSVYTPCCWAKPPFKLPTPPSPYYPLSPPTKISTTRALTINQSNSLLDSERETIQESGPRISCFSISIFSLSFFGWRRCSQLGMTRLMRRGCGTIGLELKVWLWEVPNLDLICLFDTLLQSRENLWKQFPIVKSCKIPC